MVWYFIGNSALLIGLFAWFDHRQNVRYNLFAQWTQIVSPVLSDDMKRLVSELEGIGTKIEATNEILARRI